MIRCQSKRLLNVRSLLLPLLTATLIGSTAPSIEAQVESRKSPWGAFGLSVLIPGAGQAYNGQWGKGGLMLGGYLVGGVVMVVGVTNTIDDVFSFSNADSDGLIYAGLVVAGGFWLWSWIDAPITANAINRRIDAGQVALEIGPQLVAPNRDSRVGLSLVRVRF